MPYRATTSFVAPVSKKSPVKRVITEGSVLADSDPLVKVYEKAGLLEHTDKFVERVEQATANPGELRNAVISKAKD